MIKCQVQTHVTQMDNHGICMAWHGHGMHASICMSSSNLATFLTGNYLYMPYTLPQVLIAMYSAYWTG